MINIDKIFSSFPNLETNNLYLVPPEIDKHSDEILDLLSDKTVKENYLHLHQKVETMSDVHYFINAIHEEFQNKKAITWALIEKNSGKLIGLRDLFFDSPNSPVEGQGCLKEGYRKKGYSKECYTLFFDYFEKFEVFEYTAKTYGKSIAPLRLLNSLKFETVDIFYQKPIPFSSSYSGWSILFYKHIHNEPHKIGDSLLNMGFLKDFVFFVMTLLKPYSSKLTEATSFNSGFRIDFELITYYPHNESHRKYKFSYNGNSIWKLGDTNKKPFLLDDSVMELYKYFLDNFSVEIR